MIPVLSIEGYSLAYPGPVQALSGVSLALQRGEVLGLVGESGSGKTSLAQAVMRALPRGAAGQGAIRLAGQDLCTLPERAMRAVRGRRIAMVFQDPSASLNPTLTLGEQVTEVLRRHKGRTRGEAAEEAEALLRRVGLREPAKLMRRYPHEASGGEKQRVVIAGAFAAEPECLILDEPTTALDVITARQILELFGTLQAETGVAALYISHDLALVARVAGTVAVIHRGRIVEQDPASQVFRAPRQPYTRALVAAVPRPDRRLVHDEPAPEPLLQANALCIRHGRAAPTVRDVSFAIRHGEILGMVGESGSGKSTIARALVGLNDFTGWLSCGGQVVSGARSMGRDWRRRVQIVFQHPDASLNPRQRVRDILSRPLALFGSNIPAPDAVAAMLDAVQLPADAAARYPHQLSGGQKQRVAIACAFLARPSVVVCDEITSSLDVSVQAEIVALLLDLRRRFGTATLFITHDLNLVRQIAHRIAVLQGGRLVELSDVAALGAQPYTRALLDAVPTPIG